VNQDATRLSRRTASAHFDRGSRQCFVWLFANTLIIAILVFTLTYDYKQYFGDFAKIKLFVLGIATGFLLFGSVRGTFRISAGNGRDD
jgi:hypothetical protein